jgi:hypothetical protein
MIKEGNNKHIFFLSPNGVKAFTVIDGCYFSGLFNDATFIFLGEEGGGGRRWR